MAGIVVATAEDFLRTYKDGVEIAETYYCAMDMREKDIPLRYIAKICGKAVSTIVDWGLDRHKPSCINGLEALMDLDLLDPEEAAITTATPGFQGLHYYAMLVTLTGSFTNDGAHFNSDVSSDDREYIEARRSQLSQYGLETKIMQEKREEYKEVFYLCPANKWAATGRALYALGVPTTDQQRHLPAYLRRMMEEHLGPRSKEARMLRQAARMIFEESFNPQQRGAYGVIRLRYCQTRREAWQYAEEVIQLFNTAYPKMEISMDNTRTNETNEKRIDGVNTGVRDSKQTKKYMTTILIRKKNVLAILRNYPGLLRVQAPRVATGNIKGNEEHEIT